MKINPLKAYDAINKIKQNNKTEDVKKKSLNIKDQVDISQEAKSVGKYVQKAKTSDVDRKELVEELKNKVQKGQYKVDSEKLAEKIIDSILEK